MTVRRGSIRLVGGIVIAPTHVGVGQGGCYGLEDLYSATTIQEG